MSNVYARFMFPDEFDEGIALKGALCDGKLWGLLPLCHSCHSRTISNRWYWFSRLVNYWVEDGEINFEMWW